jgi:hypothetical protein
MAPAFGGARILDLDRNPNLRNRNCATHAREDAMRLIENWKAALKHYSTIALGMAGSLQGVWASLPDQVHADLPVSVGKAVAWITFTFAIGGLAGKFVDQSNPNDPA